MERVELDLANFIELPPEEKIDEKQVIPGQASSKERNQVNEKGAIRNEPYNEAFDVDAA